MAVITFKQALINLLQPMFYADAQENNALTTYLSALGDQLFQLVQDWSSDTDDVPPKPGYSILVDATRVPDVAIPWLAQFVGLVISDSLPPSQQHSMLNGLGAW